MDTFTKQVVESLRGWLTEKQLKNIQDAIECGKFSREKYLSLNPEYVEQNFDNGGFTPRDQYALEFANGRYE